MMHQCDFLKQYMLVTGSGAMVPVPGRTAPAMGNNAVRLREGEKPPNIIFILADNVGYNDLYCLNTDIRILLNIKALLAEYKKQGRSRPIT